MMWTVAWSEYRYVCLDLSPAAVAFLVIGVVAVALIIERGRDRHGRRI